ncbi:MAG: PAS domain S-box protein [Acidobacteriota bacterium]|nr:PAS domain S-box protein [Acidobacteriota bacterium]
MAGGDEKTQQGDPETLEANQDPSVARDAALIEKLAFFEKALETTQVGVTITDKTGKILFTNPAEAKMHGYADADELIGRDVRVFAPSELWNPMAPEKVAKRGRFNRDSVNVRADGSRFPVHLVSDLVRGESGEALGVVAICQDITERKRAEIELRRAFAEMEMQAQESSAELSQALRQLNRRIVEQRASESETRQLQAELQQAQKMEAIGLLAGGVAHDFNNILTAIVGYGNLIAMQIKDNDPIGPDVQQILEAAQRGAQLTQRLLSFSRQQTMNPTRLDLSALVSGVEKMLLRMIGEDIRLTTALASEPLIVLADGGQIEQVIINLTTNARDAMPQGGTLEIGTERVRLEERYSKYHLLLEPGEYACVTVRDSGSGIDAEALDQIFEPFYTTKPPDQGTGLGLAVSYGIVKQHEGAISVYSETGLGSVFRVYLPAVEGGEEVTSHERLEPRGGSETILVAEDDEPILRMTAKLLSEFGYRVIQAHDGQEALARFREYESEIGLVLLDTVMPERNGQQVADEIARTRPKIPILFMSGYTADVLRSKGLDADDPSRFVQKPYDPAVLLTRIRQLLDAG